MRDIKDIVVLIVGLLILGMIIILYLTMKREPITIPEDYNKYKYELENARDSINKLMLEVDSQKISYNRRIDSLTSKYYNLKIYYEKEISDFGNTVIISDDDINNYIASKLQNK